MTVVYRAFDAQGRLLYIGSTVALDARMRGHQRNSAWYPFHVRVETTVFSSIAEARAAEVAAINAEHPRWNVQYRSRQHPDGVILMGRGVCTAPWLRDDLRTWRRWLSRHEAAA